MPVLPSANLPPPLPHRTTLALTSSRPFALLTATLFLLPPSPPTLAAVPYTEPFAALLSFLGMWAFLRRRHLPAALAWGVGSGFRPQGVVLGLGFFGWRFVLEEPVLRGRERYSIRVSGTRTNRRQASCGWLTASLWTDSQVLLHGLPKFAVLSAIGAVPFAAFQWWAYDQFCTRAGLAGRRPWCDQGVGMSYGWIQREYWSVPALACMNCARPLG